MQSMNVPTDIGLRARKRARTAAAIHVAAVELVHERGLDAATIDAISDRADVSTRTFFNYFPSKEDAVLGIDEVAVSRELAKPRDVPDDLLLAVFDLLYALFEASGGTQDKAELTREVVLKNPQLMTRQILRVTELEGQLTEIISGWLATQPRFVADTEAERREQAAIILGICLATVRVIMRTLATERDAEREGAPTTPPQETYERAIATLRTVLEKLT